MSILSVVFSTLVFALAFSFLIDCARNREKIEVYLRYGILFGLVLVALDAAVLGFRPQILDTVPLSSLAINDMLALLRIALCTCMGMYCCSVLKFPDAPLTRQFIGKLDTPGRVVTREFVTSIIAVALGSVAFSLILFRLARPEMSAFLAQLSAGYSVRAAMSGTSSIALGLILIEAAVAEEIIFRLGVQNYLAKKFNLGAHKYWIAIVLTGTLWSVAHACVVNPQWVKIVQIFPLGVALGALFWKFGVESCICAHAAFNLMVMCLSRFVR